MTIKRSGIEEGAVNVSVHVGGVVVNPGDMILADDDGVMVASPQEARYHLATCLQKEEQEVWMREQLVAGRAYADIRRELALS